MHHIGILAHSADGSALCYLAMVRESARRLGEHDHPEITMSVLPMKPTLAAYQAGDLVSVRTHLAATARRLADAAARSSSVRTTPPTSRSRRRDRHSRCPGCTLRKSWRVARAPMAEPASACSAPDGR